MRPNHSGGTRAPVLVPGAWAGCARSPLPRRAGKRLAGGQDPRTWGGKPGSLRWSGKQQSLVLPSTGKGWKGCEEAALAGWDVAVSKGNA